MSHDYIADLRCAREKLVQKRRAMAAEIAKVPAVTPARARDLTAVEEAIRSIDSALYDEAKISPGIAEEAPPSPWAA